MSKDRPNRALTTQRAVEAIAQRSPTCWFEPFYKEARSNPGMIPWADMEPNVNLVTWARRNGLGRDCASDILVAGCGLGDDANYLARSGSRVEAFDISPTAIEWARERFGGSGNDLSFSEADLFRLPSEFHGRFNLIVEIYTLQVLPQALRAQALEALATCLAPEANLGLLIICRARDDDEPFGELPWGVSKLELKHLETLGMHEVSFEDFPDPVSGKRRFRALYRRKNS